MHRNVCIIIINIIVKIFFLLFQVIAKCSFSKRLSYVTAHWSNLHKNTMNIEEEMLIISLNVKNVLHIKTIKPGVILKNIFGPDLFWSCRIASLTPLS